MKAFAGGCVGLVLVVACGDDDAPEPTGGVPTAVGAPSAHEGTSFLLDALDQAVIDTPWSGTDVWLPTLLPVTTESAFGGMNVQVLSFPLQRSERGDALLASWTHVGRSTAEPARVLDAVRTVDLHTMSAFDGLSRIPDVFGNRRVIVKEPKSFSLTVPRHGLESLVDLYFGFGSTAKSTNDGEVFPRLRVRVGDGAPVERVLSLDDRALASVTLAVPAGETELTLHLDVDQVSGTSGRTEMALHALVLRVEDGRDRVVVPETVGEDADAHRLRVLFQPPPPSRRMKDGQAHLLLDQGLSAVQLSRPAPFEVRVDGERVARSDKPVVILPFQASRAGPADVEVVALDGRPVEGAAEFLQPRTAFRSLPDAVRGLETSPPKHPLLRHVTLGRDTRRSLLLAAETESEWPMKWSQGDHLELSLGALDVGKLSGPRGALRVTLVAEGPDGEAPLGQAMVSANAPWSPVRVALPASGAGVLRLRVDPPHPNPRLRSMLLAVAEPRVVSGHSARPNVVLYLVDTLRADHLSAYGYERRTSPALELLAEDGVLFERAGCQAPWTKPSVASIFTGLLQSFHGAGKDATLPAGATTLAERLRGAGYYTAGFIANPYVHLRGLNFEQGFSEFVAIPPPMTAAEVHRDAVAFLDRSADRPFFLYLHTLDPHEPYDPPAGTAGKFRGDYDGPLKPDSTFAKTLRRMPGLTDADLQFVLDLYDEEILFNDRQFGRLLEELKQRDLYEETLIVFLADHGEMFRDHGGFGHGGRDLWEALLHVPLVMKLPGADAPQGVRVPERVSLTSVLPTLLSVLELDVPSAIQGEDLSPLWQGKSFQTDVIAEVEPELRSLIQGDLKLIDDYRDGGSMKLYDLSQDGAEQTDLAATDPTRAEQLRSALDARLAADREKGLALGDGQSVELTEAQRRQLQALGYLDEEDDEVERPDGDVAPRRN